MDARITKKRLSQMLSYDWIKIIACIVAGIFLWSLIFTTTAARLNPAQTFTVYAYIGTNPSSGFSSKIASRSYLSGGFSYDVIETNTVDLASAGNQAYTLLEARMGVQEGNAAFVAPCSYEIDDGKGGKISRTYMEDLLLRAYSSVLSFGGAGENAGDSKTSFFTATENFLNIYYTAGYENADSFNAKKAEDIFRNRVKAQKDKRYKTEAKIQEGINDEIARIRGYRENYLAVKGYLEEGIIKLEETTITLSYLGTSQQVTGYYSVNLCPDDRMENLKELICYQDETTGSYTAKNMQLVLLNLLSGKYSEYGYCLYENYGFIRKIVETYRNDA